MRIVIAAGVAILVLLIVGGLFVVGPYNRFVTLEEQSDAAWSQVENAYQRRADLVPNLVATVRGAADFEQETFTAVTEARSRVSQIQMTPELAADPQALARFQQAQGALGSALSRLLVTVERYPELRATEAFRDLQAQLEGTENRIAVERRRFNEAVQAYNTAIRRFPGRLVAGLFGFDSRPYFEAREGADEAPRVEF